MKPLRLSWKYAIIFVLAITPFILARCGDDHKIAVFTSQTVPVTAQNSQMLNGQSFNFTSGVVLDSTLAAQPVTVAFNNMSGANGNFTMTSGAYTADGNVVIGSCTFIVTNSTFPPGLGPQNGDIIVLDVCNLQVDIAGLPIGGAGTATFQMLVENDAGVPGTAGGTAPINIEVRDNGVLIINGTDTGVSLPFTGTGTVIS